MPRTLRRAGNMRIVGVLALLAAVHAAGGQLGLGLDVPSEDREGARRMGEIEDFVTGAPPKCAARQASTGSERMWDMPQGADNTDRRPDEDEAVYEEQAISPRQGERARQDMNLNGAVAETMDSAPGGGPKVVDVPPGKTVAVSSGHVINTAGPVRIIVPKRRRRAIRRQRRTRRSVSTLGDEPSDSGQPLGRGDDPLDLGGVGPYTVPRAYRAGVAHLAAYPPGLAATGVAQGGVAPVISGAAPMAGAVTQAVAGGPFGAAPGSAALPAGVAAPAVANAGQSGIVPAVVASGAAPVVQQAASQPGAPAAAASVNQAVGSGSGQPGAASGQSNVASPAKREAVASSSDSVSSDRAAGDSRSVKPGVAAAVGAGVAAGAVAAAAKGSSDSAQATTSTAASASAATSMATSTSASKATSSTTTATSSSTTTKGKESGAERRVSRRKKRRGGVGSFVKKHKTALGLAAGAAAAAGIGAMMLSGKGKGKKGGLMGAGGQANKDPNGCVSAMAQEFPFLNSILQSGMGYGQCGYMVQGMKERISRLIDEMERQCVRVAEESATQATGSAPNYVMPVASQMPSQQLGASAMAGNPLAALGTASMMGAQQPGAAPSLMSSAMSAGSAFKSPF